MSSTQELNLLRVRSVLIAREVKAVLCAMPEIFGARRPRWLWRWLFLGPEGRPHRAGEIILADLRRYAGLDRATHFDPDPIIMAYRQGRRDTVLRMINYLNLDEAAVQQLLELQYGYDEYG
jgi:hypothetical protein